MSDTARTDAAVNAGRNQLPNVAEESRLFEKELAAFKKNNEELIQRHNAAIASWDEERERALREADRVKEWREKYEDLEKYIRFIGKQIPCITGGTFENDPVDAILDAAVRSLNDRKPTRVDELNSVTDAIIASWKEEKEHMKLAHDKTLDSLEYAIERTKAFEALAEMLYKAEYDNSDAIKKIYETVREKYPVGTYYTPCRLERENAALRAELNAQAVVNGKGGEREAKLLSIISRIRWVIDRELDWSQAQRLEKAGELCDEVLGKEAQP